jgi:hypothetical protein
MPIHIQARIPHQWAIIASFVLFILAVLGHLTRIPYLTTYDFWIGVIGYIVLLVAVLY